jgi:hypothetical protein
MPVGQVGSPGRPLRASGFAALLALVALLAPAPALRADDEPWRLRRAVGSPAWLELSGTYRVRYEALSSHLRPGPEGSDRLLAERLLVAARVGDEKLYGRLEIEDSRAHLDDDDTPLGTDDVNAAEVLQLHLGGRIVDLLRPGDRLELQAGRMTLDVGSRRLVARNSFRNTINSFTGVHGAWRGPGRGAAGGAAGGEGAIEARAFYLLPVDLRPTERDRLDDNEAQLDRDNSSVRFWGLHLSDPRLAADLEGEAYVLGLEEDDRPSAPTRNRDLVTAGARLSRSPARARWDFELETAFQTGESRRSTARADTRDLDHQAWFAHAHAARTFDARGAPRLVLQYDYASGDDDPSDGRNGRFDTLFGARRFEFGPTGIFGLLARSNIASPGVRLELAPKTGRSLVVGYRAAWLASRRDALTTNGVQDPTGASGSFVGHLLEAQVRVSLLPGNLGLELGGARLFAGEFLTSPRASLGDATYGYVQTTFTF